MCLSSAQQRAGVHHVTVVIFLEFFAWGLVTTLLPEVVRQGVGKDRMWLALGKSSPDYDRLPATPTPGTLAAQRI